VNRATVGLFAGMLVGIGLAFGGFGDAVIIGALGFIGWIVAKVVEGDIDLDDYIGRRQRR